MLAWFRTAIRSPTLKHLAANQPAVCVRLAWALHVLSPHELGMYKVTLLQVCVIACHIL